MTAGTVTGFTSMLTNFGSGAINANGGAAGAAGTGGTAANVAGTAGGSGGGGSNPSPAGTINNEGTGLTAGWGGASGAHLVGEQPGTIGAVVFAYI